MPTALGSAFGSRLASSSASGGLDLSDCYAVRKPETAEIDTFIVVTRPGSVMDAALPERRHPPQLSLRGPEGGASAGALRGRSRQGRTRQGARSGVLFDRETWAATGAGLVSTNGDASSVRLISFVGADTKEGKLIVERIREMRDRAAPNDSALGG